MVVRIDFMMLLTLFLVLSNPAAAASSPQGGGGELTWEAICAASVCRGTGHDGVFALAYSPDGGHLVADVRGQGEQGLYLIDTDGEVRYWTAGHSADWRPDGSGIVFVRDSDLWTIGIGAESPTRLTDDEHDLRAPRIAPSGDRIVFASTRSGHQDLWLLELDQRANVRRLTDAALPVEEARFDHSWSPDGRSIAYISNRADVWSDDLWLVDVESGQSRILTTDLMVSGTPVWSPDGSRIAVYGTAKEDFWYTELDALFLIDIASGRSAAIPMQVDARGPGAPAWHPDGKALFFPVHQRGDVELWRVPVEGGVATRLTHEGGLIHDWDMSPDGEVFALARSTSTRGREIDLLPASGGRLERATDFSTAWSGLVEPEEISVRSWDGLYVQAFLFRPPDFDETASYPAVIQVHGGGTHSYYNGLNLVEQRLAQRGYVVLALNYRGGSGFGREFQDLGVGDWANGQALDAAAAARYVRAQPWSNGKVGIYGYSYGGIISLAAVARAPDAFDAAVPMAGIYDFAAAYRNADRVIRLFVRQGHGGAPDERTETYTISNTLQRLDAVETPILLMHGEADTIAPFDQFERAAALLEQHGKVFEAHSYPGEPHRFRDPANRVDLYRRMEAWMDRWLKKP